MRCPSAVGERSSDRANDAAVDAEGRARCAGSRSTADEGNERPDLGGLLKAPQQRAWPHLPEEVLLDLCTTPAARWGEARNEPDDTLGRRGPGQHAVYGDVRPGEALGEPAGDGDLCRLGDTVMDHLSRNLQ